MIDETFVKVVNKILQDKGSTTICIFDKGEFYMCFEKHALFLAKQIFKSTTVIKQLTVAAAETDAKLQYVNINKNQFERIIKELLLFHQYRVELYRCVNAKNQEWELSAEASPGNLTSFEDILTDTGNMMESTAVVALKISSQNDKLTVAIACCDISNFILKVAEFPDGPRFSCLESLLVQIGPKECLLCVSGDNKNVIEKQSLEAVLKRVNVVVTERKQSEFKTNDIVGELNQLLRFRKGEQRTCATYSQLNMKTAVDCLSALLKYLNLKQDSCNFGKYSFDTFTFGQYVRIDAAAVKALELFDCSFTYISDKNTLFGLLNNCQTSAGKRLLDEWIKMPLLDKNKINERLDAVEAFVENSEVRNVFRQETLNKIDDLPKLMRSFAKGRAGLQEVFKVFQAVIQIPQIKKRTIHMQKYAVVLNSMFIHPLDELFNDFSKYIAMVDSTLEIHKNQNSQSEVRVKPDFDENLQRLSSDLENVESSIKKELNRAAKDLNLEAEKSLKLDNSTQLGYYFRVTRKEEKLLRNNKAYEILEATKAGIRFTSKKLRSLNDDYTNLTKEYEKVQENIVDEIVKIASGYLDPIQRLCHVLAVLDVILSFAELAATARIPYVRPEIFEQGHGILALKDARHPCLEQSDDLSFISNDICLEKGKAEFVIITGPNMGGKSTFLRQTALIVLMAQMGCFVPCSSASISIVDAIFTRVGASDCQLKGVSTFMSEMLETASILEVATENSLIIIDELGRGTSTYDGFGLAYAIAEHIALNVHAFTLFATHFHEMASLSNRIPTVHNYNVSASVVDNRVTLLYKIAPGVCDESFGIHIAEMVNFPKRVIDEAWEKVALYSNSGPLLKLQEAINDESAASLKDKADNIRMILNQLRNCFV